MRKNIFEIERRVDFEKEFDRLISYLNNRNLSYKSISSSSLTFWNISNYYFEDWKYRLTALDISQYLADLDISSKDRDGMIYFNIYDPMSIKKLLIIELITNLINYFIEKRSSVVDQNKYIFNNIITNIKLMLEQQNYKIEHIEDRVIIVKRDADIDSVLPLVADEETVRLALLSYLDFRNENDVEEKKKLLKIIADYMEPQRNEFNIINKKLSDDVFYAFNSFSIRHNNPKQVAFNAEEQLQWYDRTFKLALHLLREKELKEYRENITIIKSDK